MLRQVKQHRLYVSLNSVGTVYTQVIYELGNKFVSVLSSTLGESIKYYLKSEFVLYVNQDKHECVEQMKELRKNK